MVATLGAMVPYVLDAAVGSTPGTQVYYFHNDHLGTPQAITDETGAVVWKADYDPFGEANPVVQVIESNFRFPGQYFDEETGLHQNWHRDCMPSIGRYLQADPLGLSGGVNLYAYVGNVPVNAVDPSGLILELIWNDPTQRAEHKDIARTIGEFISHAKGKTLSELQHEGGEYAGPAKTYRYVINPRNPKEVIDMRHFLVVGPAGELVGLGIEILQLGMDMDSAFNAQDFLSNALGSDFFSNYYDPDDPDKKTLAEQLEMYFEGPKEKECK